MKYFCLLLVCLLSISCFCQVDNKPFIHLQEPARGKIVVKNSRQFIVGSTCKTCSLTLNGQPVKVYPTGAFAYELNLKTGDSAVNLIALSAPDLVVNKKLQYSYIPAKSADTVKSLEIADIETFPEGNLFVEPGDLIKIRVKSLTGCAVTANGNIPLYELPAGSANGMPGIYQGEYLVKGTDSFLVSKFRISVTDKNNKTVSSESKYWVSSFGQQAPHIAVTKGRLAHLLFGLGEDRLGGAKIGYLDSMVLLNVTGKVGSNYKLRLSKYHTAYIPEDLVQFLPKGSFTPESLTTNWRVYGDSLFDYVALSLSARLPYQSFQLIDPSRVVVDVYGATNNSNWITQLENVKEIRNVYYEQVEDEVFRITIELKHAQHWGHQIYYKGNTLVVKIKRQPESLLLRGLTVAVDAGHGGTNTGAEGPTGVSEKNLTLAVALKLQKSLEQEGARVIMTRTTEKFVDNKDRILFYRDSMPDLLVSIHLNSAGDPIRVTGTSTYYRYIGFRNLSHDIYKRMLELGLKEYGNTGSFNFMLNSPTEYPNALVETVFLSNPEDEMKILDEGFQQQIADKIILGMKDFLEGCRGK